MFGQALRASQAAHAPSTGPVRTSNALGASDVVQATRQARGAVSTQPEQRMCQHQMRQRQRLLYRHFAADLRHVVQARICVGQPAPEATARSGPDHTSFRERFPPQPCVVRCSWQAAPCVAVPPHAPPCPPSVAASPTPRPRPRPRQRRPPWTTTSHPQARPACAATRSRPALCADARRALSDSAASVAHQSAQGAASAGRGQRAAPAQRAALRAAHRAGGAAHRCAPTRAGLTPAPHNNKP